MKVAIPKFCFFFQDCIPRSVKIPSSKGESGGVVVFDPQKAGCRFGNDFKKCGGICPQFVVFPGKVIDDVRAITIIRMVRKGAKYIRQGDVVDWLKKGRKGKPQSKWEEDVRKEVEKAEVGSSPAPGTKSLFEFGGS